MGELIDIFLTDREGGTPFRVDHVEAVVGRGLRGDRYFAPETRERLCPDDQQVTLIALEAIQAANEQLGLTIEPLQFRRNLLTCGIDLNALVGHEFEVGDVRLFAIEPCDPCRRLERFTVPGMMRALLHHGGLRCTIRRGGVLHVGDPVRTPS